MDISQFISSLTNSFFSMNNFHNISFSINPNQSSDSLGLRNGPVSSV